MTPLRLSFFSLLMILAHANSVLAQVDPGSRPVADGFPQGFDQVVYKGLVGNVLDTIPMDPSERLGIQRTSAVVSNTYFGRSLAILAGLSNPILMLGGLIWGVWAASNIAPAEADLNLIADPMQSGGSAGTQEPFVVRLERSSAADSAPVSVLARSSAAADSDAAVAAVPRPRVIKLWLPRRAQVFPQ